MPDNLLLSLKPGYLRLGNIVLAAEIQHFLSFFETADEGAAEIASTKDEAAGMNSKRLFGHANLFEVTIAIQGMLATFIIRIERAKFRN